MNKYEQLAEAIKIATNAHAGQFDNNQNKAKRS